MKCAMILVPPKGERVWAVIECPLIGGEPAPFFMTIGNGGTYYDLVGRCWGRPIYRQRIVLDVDETPPIWFAWDDDDWGGATANNWVHSFVKPGVRIVLTPPRTVTDDLIRRMRDSFVRLGAHVDLIASRAA